jgi:glycosyltransferase involved in cell wall biosynthesis
VRVLIYTHPFAPQVGGIETYTMLLAQGLSTPSKGTSTDLIEVTVATRAAANGMNDSALPFRVVRRPRFLKLVDLVRRADVIHVAGPAFLPMLLGWLLRKAIAVEHDGYQAACPNGLFFYEPTKTDCPGHFLPRRYHLCLRCNWQNSGRLKSLWMLLMTFPRRWLCRRMTINIGASYHVARRVALPRSQTVYHGVPNSSAGLQDEAVSVSPPLCFVYVGRMVREKGLPVLLRAARRLADCGYAFRLKLIGDGPERTALERMVNDLGLGNCTHFTGFLTGKELQEAMKGSAAAVMPSLWEDVSPLSAIEQMIQGRPLVASDIGGLGELVDAVGLKFTAGDDAGLAECLRRILDRPELARELGKKARERALELFTQERMVNDHRRLYFQLKKQNGDVH